MCCSACFQMYRLLWQHWDVRRLSVEKLTWLLSVETSGELQQSVTGHLANASGVNRLLSQYRLTAVTLSCWVSRLIRRRVCFGCDETIACLSRIATGLSPCAINRKERMQTESGHCLARRFERWKKRTLDTNGRRPKPFTRSYVIKGTRARCSMRGNVGLTV